MKLEIGGGKNPKAGYTNMDVHETPDIKHDATVIPYPFEDGSCEEIYSHWVLEHFSPRDIDMIIEEWKRILAPNGKITAVTNNGEAHVFCYINGDITWNEFNRLVFGIQAQQEIGDWEPTNVYECHKVMYSPESVRQLFERHGFTNIDVQFNSKCREDDGSIKCPGIVVEARL